MKKTISNDTRARRTILFSLIGNALLMIVKLITGIVGNSFAIIADAFESAGDVFSSFIIFLGLRISAKPSDDDHPFGHGKVEPLISFLVVLFLIGSAAFIAFQAISNLQSPQKMPEPYTLIVLGGIIIYKELFFHYVRRKSKQTGSTSLKADAWHHRSDAITSLAAFIGIGLALILGEGYEMLDDWAALVASVIIVINAYFVFRPALGELLDEQKYDDLIGKVREVSEKVDGVIDTEKCFIRKFGMRYVVDIHVRVSAELSVIEGHTIGHAVQDAIQDSFPEVEHVFTHVEPK
ncbi:MAG: cation diffusion facilitator family transporter [Dysgonamonadaceae bacterium]|jgi:cation diffusion facilitator family transporter|nr:cation diffusion facilitator family transporter [Dysgonamonadaceae bacterium]MDD3356586.1 cation diffusion facilitator family transporter [Dysgonamonadaceae bacterium]